MFSFFTPRYLSDAKMVLKNAQKLLDYKRDLLSEEKLAEFAGATKMLETAMKQRDQAAVREAIEQLEAKWQVYLPPAGEAGWRENCEVFLVAIVIAIGVRTYFIQPFTIPTGSMQPTLYGIIGTNTGKPAPNPLVRGLHACLYGRSYVDVVAQADESVLNVAERTWLFFFTVTDIQCTSHTYHAWAPKETLLHTFPLGPVADPVTGEPIPRKFKQGEVIAQGYINTGDHVFVDKVSYHFRPPAHGNVFVFSTKDIRGMHANPAEGSQFYIKRLVGLPGDTLRIDPPKLFVNGTPANSPGSERVMSQQKGYKGYGLGPMYSRLSAPEDELRLPPKSYFAMGDNSYNSSDSRYWGFVPEQNIMGQAVFVYWPFGEHWGFIQ